MKNKEEKYLSKAEFVKKAKITPRTAERLVNKLLEEQPDHPKIKREKNGRVKLHRSLLIRYVSDEYLNIEAEKRKLEREIRSLKNTIDCITNTKEIGYVLHNHSWSFFGAVNYKEETSKKRCRDTMVNLYKHLFETFGKQTEIKFFFTTEDVHGGGNNHSHFVLYLSDATLLERAKAEIEKHLEGQRVYIDQYTHYKAGIFYNCKEGLRDTNWDILGSSLSPDGIF
jgi:hypothetical protein